MILERLTNDGFSPKQKTANEYSCSCPRCGGEDRFLVWPEQNKFWCRQCESSGDEIQYLRDFHNMDFHDAAEVVGKKTSPLKGSSLNANLNSIIKKNSQKIESPSLWIKATEELISHAHQELLKHPTALDWLRGERGIKRRTAEKFHLGWLEKNIYPSKQRFGLKADGKDLLIPSGLVIPWKKDRIRIRRDDPGDYGRYYVVPGSKSDPFLIGQPNEVPGVIVESELDAILLSQEIKRNLFIIALGSAQAKPDEKLTELLNLCPAIIVALDNDEPGSKASKWWIKTFTHATRTLTPRECGKDITEAFQGDLDLNEWISISLEIHNETIMKQ